MRVHFSPSKTNASSCGVRFCSMKPPNAYSRSPAWPRPRGWRRAAAAAARPSGRRPGRRRGDTACRRAAPHSRRPDARGCLIKATAQAISVRGIGSGARGVQRPCCDALRGRAVGDGLLGVGVGEVDAAGLVEAFELAGVVLVLLLRSNESGSGQEAGNKLSSFDFEHKISQLERQHTSVGRIHFAVDQRSPTFPLNGSISFPLSYAIPAFIIQTTLRIANPFPSSSPRLKRTRSARLPGTMLPISASRPR